MKLMTFMKVDKTSFRDVTKVFIARVLSDDNVESFITKFAKSDLQEVQLGRE